jgi:hypothetical protein
MPTGCSLAHQHGWLLVNRLQGKAMIVGFRYEQLREVYAIFSPANLKPVVGHDDGTALSHANMIAHEGQGIEGRWPVLNGCYGNISLGLSGRYLSRDSNIDSGLHAMSMSDDIEFGRHSRPFLSVS